MYPSPLEKLIQSFSRFPSVGIKVATRFAFYCFNAPGKEIEELIKALQEIKKSLKTCKVCFRSIEKGESLCSVCKNKNRDHSIICLVEKETDLISLEKISEYNGIYFILGGTVSPLKKKDFKKIRSEELKKRLNDPSHFNLPPIREIIIATNQTTEGDATAIYLSRLLSETKIKITRLGKGLPTGGELEYADEETLLSALKGRN